MNGWAVIGRFDGVETYIDIFLDRDDAEWYRSLYHAHNLDGYYAVVPISIREGREDDTADIS
jgi:hypothetical protein